MKTRIAIAVASILAGCSTISSNHSNQPATGLGDAGSGARVERPETIPAHTLTSISVDRYKRTLAQHIADVNSDKIYPGNPQAMLRSVVVVRYVVDSNGRLIRSDTFRSNSDSTTVATALSALRSAAPFPHPPRYLLNHDQVELMETMLFNDDGRFQLRSIAAPQLGE